MTLTHENVIALNAAFASEDHKFVQNKAYLNEEAISYRLDTVDPSWTWERLQVSQRDDTITFIGRLTVCGVSRDGVGMARVEWTSKKDKQGNPLKDQDNNIIWMEANEAEKAAASDALKRAARLFGIGRYLLRLPKDGSVGNHEQLAKWLGEVAEPQQPQKIDKATGEVKPDKPAAPKATNGAQVPVAKLTREQWAHLKSEYGSDLVRAGLKVEKGSDWQGTYEQAVNAILAVNVPF